MLRCKENIVMERLAVVVRVLLPSRMEKFGKRAIADIVDTQELITNFKGEVSGIRDS